MGETLSDGHFLKRWHAARDGEAFYELVRRHSGMVYATCLRMLRNSHDAEEVAQDTFLALAQSQSRIEAYAGQWLHRVATNRCLDRLKAGQRREQRERAVADTLQSPETVSWDDLQELVDEAVDALPEPERAAIVAHFLEGQTHEAIAQNLGLTRQAVSHRIKRGIEATREALRKRGVTISAGALSILVAENAQATVPTALAASLGKLSLAGAKHVAAGGMVSGEAAASPTMLATLLGAKTVAVMGIVMTVCAIGWFVRPDHAPAIVVPTHSPETTVTLNDGSPPNLATPPIATTDAAPASRDDTDSATDPALSGTITGKVTDTNGNPVEGAQVVVLTPPNLSDLSDGRDAEDPAVFATMFADRSMYFFATTAADGTYTVADLPSDGVAIVGLSKPSTVVGDRSHELELSRGGVLDGIDFEAKPATTMHGLVSSPTGQPIRDAIVFCTDTGAILITAGDGGFSLGLEPGYSRPSFLVYHESNGLAAFEDIPIVDGEVTELKLRGRSSLQGQILTAEHTPAVGYKVELELSAEDTGVNRSLLPFATTDERGNYRIEDIPSSEYYVLVKGPHTPQDSGRNYIGPLIAGEGRVWNYVVQPPMEIYGTVRGQIRRQPMPEQLVLWAVDRRIVFVEETGLAGEYRMKIYSAPGTHLIAPKSTLSRAKDELPDEWLPFAQKVQFVPGGTRQLDLFLPDTFTAAVRFLDENNQQVTQGIRVNGVNADESSRSSSSNTLRPDAAGRYVWDGFSSQLDCSFQAWPNEDPTYIFAHAEVPVPSSLDEIVEVTARIYRWAELEGVLLGPDGTPLADENFTIELDLANGEPYVLIGGSTNEEGYFHIGGDPSRNSRAIPASAFTMRVKWFDSSQAPWSWISDVIHPAPRERISIETVQLR